jgi:phenylalanyl-tRNA synthetase beta chain
MNLSLNWLKEFVDLPKKLTAEELAARLTLRTVEVEGVVRQSDKFKNIVIGKILEVKKHPNADRLSLAIVNIGERKLNIVCGADNIQAGQLVPVAMAGAILPSGLEIKEAEVRGERSEGMLCAEDELGLGEDHSGILILDNNAKIGKNFSTYLNINDIVLEVDHKSLTNRPDLLSHYGIAREISAIMQSKFKPLKYFTDTVNCLAETKLGEEKLDIKVADTDLCPRYTAVAFENITIAPSPKWIEEKLVAIGCRPINNIVDITNYVMMELGQPLHAFDKNLVDKIFVRRAKTGESIETLDGVKRELLPSDLVIADSRKPIAIAGVMGGAVSEISPETKSIIFESANFEFSSIRKTSQRLGLRTEASARYEKALDPELTMPAILRVIELVNKVCPEARITSFIFDSINYQPKTISIILDPKWLAKRIGEKIKISQVAKILESLGFTVKPAENKLEVIVPSWRATKDISIPEDLMEEVIRIYGYEKLPAKMPMVEMKAPSAIPEKKLIREIKNILPQSTDFSETSNYSFVGEEQLKKLGSDIAAHIRLANPVSSQFTMLRQSLAPNMIANVKFNQPRYNNIRLFEIGSIFSSITGDLAKDRSGDKLPYQEKRLGLISAGPNAMEEFGHAKGAINKLFEKLGLDCRFAGSTSIPSWGDSGFSVAIMSRGVNVGQIDKLHSLVKTSLNIKKETVIAEINMRELLNLCLSKKSLVFQEFDKYPQVIRDLAFVVNEKVLYNEVRDEILNFNVLIKSVELFDVFAGGNLGIGKKSLAFHISYQADRTLNSAEIENIQAALIKHLDEKFSAQLR